jgi:hypothetical protein
MIIDDLKDVYVIKCSSDSEAKEIEKMHKKEDNSSKMSYNGITTNHELRELLSYEYKYT